MPSFFAWIEQHPHLPHVLMVWLQLAFNVVMVAYTVLLVYGALSTVRNDVDKAAAAAAADAFAESAACRRQWLANRCGGGGGNNDDYGDDDDGYGYGAGRSGGHLPPALEAPCSAWRVCMERDADAAVGRARVSALTLAQIVNAFAEHISFRAMVS